MKALSDHRRAVRIIDANLNRAREALRVMEEYARLALDDTCLTTVIKDTRHDLARCVPDEWAGVLIAARDIASDVGCEVRTAGEYTRADALDVARAAGKRLGEALRTIEEYGKTIDAAFAQAVERIRYSGYDLERRLDRTAGAKERLGRLRLYVILTESLCRGEWFATAEAAIRGGADALQLREKTLPDRELLARAERLAALCRRHGALFIVNDRPDIAVLSGADGVHLGRDDVSIAQARRFAPTTLVVGSSTHTIDEVKAAASGSPDYIAVGPMFSSSTKPQADIPGPPLLAEARRQTSLPLVAIGGIDESNAGHVLAMAPCVLCVCQAVIAQADVERAAAGLRALADQAT